ncbi:MAG: sensor histidine kinase [Gemmatimonadaceae bacterium]
MNARAWWRWSSWSLNRKLPVLTAAIVVVVVASSLALTYDALRRGRIDAMNDRLQRLARQLVTTSDVNLRARFAFVRQVAADSAVLSALRHANAGRAIADTAGVSQALLRLRAVPDSSLPIELWTNDERRIARVGTEVRGDSLMARRPELRTLGARGGVSEITTRNKSSDSIQVGAMYGAGGNVLYWTIVPVRDRDSRIGFIAQQRAFRNTAQSATIVKELLGNDVTLYLHNATDGFWSTYMGEPTTPVAGIDSATNDFIGTRAGVGRVLAHEQRLNGLPWVVDVEAPMAALLAEPLATLRRLAMLSLIIAALGVIAAWLISRRITYPLTSLATVSEALARGDYESRVPERRSRESRDEVTRLAATFNRMASEIEGSHRMLEKQVADAEATNQKLQQLSADAEEARDAAQQANRAKSDFLAVMSHELRTPLNAIGGYAEILQLGIHGDVTEKQRDAIARITRSQQMLLSLINDVLNFAKLDAGHVQYQMDDVQLHDTIAAIEPLIEPQLGARRLAYRFDCDCDTSPVVRADRDKLQQIVLNLLSNAIKFTAPGGQITLSCEEDGESVLTHVTDTGIGIAAERIEAIFDPFVQVDRALNRPHDGVGLGLSISRDLARGMGGRLEVESEIGVGSTFTLRLQKG